MIIYHTGYLARDRQSDPALHERALEFLVKGTAWDRRIYRFGDLRGKGEGYLTQRKLYNEIYEYRFTPKVDRHGLERRGP